MDNDFEDAKRDVCKSIMECKDIQGILKESCICIVSAFPRSPAKAHALLDAMYKDLSDTIEEYDMEDSF